MKRFTRDETEHGQEYYLASEVDKALAQPAQQADHSEQHLDMVKAQPTSGDYVQPDLSTLRHEDNCRHWDDGEFCTCGALEYHEMQYWKAKALAQPAPQQKPVAWMDIDEKGSASGLRYWSEPDNRHEVALYTTPPQRTWVGLTEARAKEIWLKGKDHGDDWLDVLALAGAFEAELKEKNT